MPLKITISPTDYSVISIDEPPDGVRTDGEGYGKLPQSSVISGGTWHKVQMYLINDNAGQNPNHYAIKSYSGFALDLSSINSNVTYQMRNLKSIVY